ncbi:MAG: hypothetical protein Q4G43_07830 [Mobilicoccus sp.]|nr:hypothetical protein [Mobilicoccus sp.]
MKRTLTGALCVAALALTACGHAASGSAPAISATADAAAPAQSTPEQTAGTTTSDSTTTGSESSTARDGVDFDVVAYGTSATYDGIEYTVGAPVGHDAGEPVDPESDFAPTPSTPWVSVPIRIVNHTSSAINLDDIVLMFVHDGAMVEEAFYSRSTSTHAPRDRHLGAGGEYTLMVALDADIAGEWVVGVGRFDATGESVTVQVAFVSTDSRLSQSLTRTQRTALDGGLRLGDIEALAEQRQ